MFDDLKIRNKLILLMAGPIVIILLLSALGGRARQQSARESSEVETLVTTSQANSDVVNSLQLEALYSSAYVASNRETWKDQLAEARKGTDATLAVALPRLTDGLGGTSTGVQTSASLAVEAANKLTFYRDTVDQGLRPDQFGSLVVSYGDMEATFLAVNTTISDSLTNTEAAAELRGANVLGRYKSAIARQGSLVAGAAELEEFPSAETYDLFRDALAAESAQSELLSSISGASRKGAVRDAMASDASESLTIVTDVARANGGDGGLRIDAEAAVESTSTVVADLHEVESSLYDGLIGDAASAAAAAERAADLFLVAAVVGILFAVLAAVVLGRRITRPLRKLTEAADTLSQEQMPKLIETLKNPASDDLGYQIGSMKPIDIRSDDEIGHLARSFNEVQRVAGEVAAEQAQLLRKGIGEMFVNLARRNQALLDRQIEFIDELERGEEDPDQLENLYRLDHLATRMRRNAESLLVLAGAEPPRRRGRPAPLANVVRAALAEVEDFNRIELLSFDEVLVASNAAADLAHLLSELMENATNFSPPETRVEVVGHKTKADGYVISITDHGIGMSGDQITEANESLARPPLVGLAMSRSLGFIVVGRLASRHGIAVRMMPSAAGGVTAVVSIPPSLVVDTPGGMAEPAAAIEAPARLKPVLESSNSSGMAPLSFGADVAPAGAGSSPAAADGLPGPVAWSTDQPATEDRAAPRPTPRPTTPPLTAAPPSVPEPAAPPAAAPVPTSSIFDGPAPSTAPVADAATAAIAAEVDKAVEPAMPAALSFDAPRDPVASATPAKAPVPPAVAEHQGGATAAPSKPFFLEDAAPPRPFGIDAKAGDPAAAPAPAPAAPAPAPPRLFGGPAPTPAADLRAPATPAAPADPPPMARRTPKPPAAPGAPVLDTPPPPAPAPAAAPAAPPAPSAPASPAPAEPAPKTATGLAKRVPRSAGASRAIPGSEVERGVSATRRSPEEIRNMLSQHSAGRQRARVQEQPVPSGAPDEREPHE